MVLLTTTTIYVWGGQALEWVTKSQSKQKIIVSKNLVCHLMSGIQVKTKR